jgi:hypothetical protein
VFSANFEVVRKAREPQTQNQESFAVKKIVLAALVACVCFGFLAGTAKADFDLKAIEPYADGLYWDGSPTGNGICEIHEMRLKYTSMASQGQRFDFEITTNFGDLATRTGYGSGGDSYGSSGTAEIFPAGDLYIRVHDPDATNNTTDRVYGLVLESRDGTDTFTTTMSNAGYGTYSAKNAGELYKWNPQIAASGFATGTYEGYAAAFNEIPVMSEAQALPGLIDLASSGDLANAYPTIMLGGLQQSSYTSVSGYTSTTFDVNGAASGGVVNTGVWSGSFVLPEDVSEKYVEVWWSMGCGNDAVVVGDLTGVDVPTPSSLLLCGIGIAFAAVGKRLRRRK